MEEVIAKIITIENGFKEIENIAKKIVKNNDSKKCYYLSIYLYRSEYYQVRELAVFILGFISIHISEALLFLKNNVSKDENWRVQEILAKSFDYYCSEVGYDKSLPVIKEWLSSDNPNIKRAVTEGLRVWTIRDYFKTNPTVAISLLSSLKDDDSEYLRKSVGNALRDISKKHPDLVKNELNSWDVSNKKVELVYNIASKRIFAK
ncbi:MULTISPECIES: DNA alkylation repair protein [unclassified Clostridioides]|uniref:DNA alkylation repair protein n=1 Tax=unclassified Clostridioides TaxID=2635829 RepID=UPI001D124587|nr:DNA alkylation repair protein [Clostridioides sp. ZZV14-6154]MCC0670101.1 DNA alkylation repair protein [Clostridioides sp. ZZV14-6153]MCC0724308.1 DNA alkylation repair protein [Clostridioides sp. ZZV14-6104]MCC0728550.1 DNA alkylation repair protein [Clostridioides sp. ZZV14-6045]MCC0732666.1 DNA alkylation repair protein [Clostridioides sp. ZZV14-6048]MCC0736584.1 DNA alkylation repair protein [Clostridioides sp. ZZV14-6009]